MDAQETQKETLTTADSGDGNQPEESKAVAKLRKDNERLEAQLAKKKELYEEQKALEARDTLGGRADAGVKPEKPAEETPKEYAEKVLGGALNQGK